MKNLAPIHAVIPKGSLDSTSTATVMTATVPGVDALFNGVCVWLTNGVITSAANFTININGLGGKPVYSSQSAASRATTIFNVNYTALLIYNETRVSGGCWDYVYGYDSNTNTIGYQVRTNSLSLPMKSIVYRYRLLFTSADGKGFVPANNSTSTNATTARTVCQDKIDPFGRIVYYGTTASVAAGSRPSASYLWQQYAFSIGYSFVVTLTEWKPVYLKCAPQSDGSAIIDSTTPFVQTLPSTEDGKIYIFLGVAYSSTNIELTLEHPVYCYKNGCIRQWTNAASDGAVSSVNGQTGAVSLGAADVGALPDTYTAPVTSVNTKTGAVSLSASDVGALPDDTAYVSSFNGSTGAVTYTAPVTSVNGNTGAVTVAVPSASSATPQALGTAAAGSSTNYSRADHVHAKPTYSKSDVGLGNVDNVKQYSASNPPPYPVTSVNGSTGAVTVAVPSASSATPKALGTAAAGTSTDYSRADHVHAKPTYGKSDVGLGNVDNVKQYSASNPPPYPVTSVNGSTGAVSIAVPTKTSDLTNDSGFITGMYIASYGSSTYAQVLAAYQANKIVYCRASSNTNPATGDQKRLAFLAYVSDPTTPTEFEFQYYRSVATHSDSQQGDQVFIYKLNSSTGWSVTTREAYTKISPSTGLSKSYSSGTLTVSVTNPLPSVSASDNGKVLTVVNGAWAAASLPVYNGGVS